MVYIAGIITGILLSGIVLYGATRFAKPLNELFTVNSINTSVPASSVHINPAQIIKRQSPQDKFLSNE